MFSFSRPQFLPPPEPTRLFLLAAACLLLAPPLLAQEAGGFREDAIRILSLRDHNTRVVVFGATFLGIASGLVGTFLLLRKRALLSDAVSHATLPGVVLAFLIVSSLGGDGKSLPFLLLGAAVTGVVGMLCVSWIREATRLGDDAALGIVLSVFFGIGIALLGMATRSGVGNAAGLESFIYGRTASMVTSDAQLIGWAGLVIAIASLALTKEFSLVCFDADFGRTQGWPVYRLDVLLMSLVVAVTVIGLQAVGLILVVAMLIIPPASARFWTHRLGLSLVLAAAIGGTSALVGALLSALFKNMPSGAVIVLTGTLIFLISFLLGKERGLVWRVVRHHLLSSKIRRQHLLRALYETSERTGRPQVTFQEIVAARSWKPRRVERLLAWASRAGLAARHSDGWALTPRGNDMAIRLVRNHRLWEMYLLEHADIAPAVVDRDADRIEHVLDAELIARLEERVRFDRGGVPSSPHALDPEAAP